MPTILPNDAPIAMEGTNIPAGTLHPYETMTKSTRRMVAMSKEKTMDHLLPALYIVSISHSYTG